MIRFLGVLIACCWAFAGWQNMPRLENTSATAAGVAIAGTCLLSFWAGHRWHGAQATASAVAHAEARAAALANSRSQATSNVFVQIAPEMGARSVGAQRLGGLDGAEWIGARREVSEDDVMAAMEDGGVALDIAEVEA